MRVVALLSGGKDSCFSMMQCVAAGHDIIALANLFPIEKDELDSFMFQTVGHEGVKFISEAISLPLYRQPTFGKSEIKSKSYIPTEDDEVEDLYLLLKKVKECENIEAVSCGAIASEYQRLRVENVCSRLGLVSLAYLWQRDQEELLNEMIQCSVNAIIIKVACLGLGYQHLNKSLAEMQPHLINMKTKFGLNVCGEGGEYETFTLDCPLFTKSIRINEFETIAHSESDIAPVGYLRFRKLELIEKTKELENVSLKDRLRFVAVNSPYDYISEILCTNADEDLNSDGDEWNSCALDNIESRSTITKDNPYLFSALNMAIDDNADANNSTANENQSGWLWFGGITSNSSSPLVAMEESLNKLHNFLVEKNINFSDIVLVNLYIKDMANYSLINDIYVSKFAKVNPPVRVCVECPLKVHVLLDALAYKDGSQTKDGLILNKHILHVQSISHWAPANIGPYSQAVQIGSIILVAGQIPFVPGSMTMPNLTITQECRLTMRHIQRLLIAVDNQLQLADVVQGICFLSDLRYISAVRKEWQKETKSTIDDYIVVTNLPRNAKIEWSVWSHKDNRKFKYEEICKNIGKTKIFLRRRWSHDNNVSVMTGLLSFNLSTSVDHLQPESDEIPTFPSVEDLIGFFEFILCHLKKGSEARDYICTLKIFYKLNILSSNIISNVIQKICNQNSVISIIPALYLHNRNTFLSVCGICHK